MLRKRTLFFIFFALILLVFTGYASRGPIGSTFFEWYLKGYCRTCLNSRLTYENLRHENGQWVFDSPVLTSKKRLEEGGYRIQAESASLNVSISWLKRSLDFSVGIEKPHVDIGKGAEEFRKLIDQPPQTFHLFEVHTKFHVPHGTIFVHDFTEDHLVPAPLFFHIDLACKESRQGCASLWVGENEQNGNGKFLVSFSETEKHEPQVLLELQDLCCTSTQQILKGIWPQYKSLGITSGSISGAIAMVFPEGSSRYAKGQISLKELVMRHPGMDFEMAVPEASLNLTPNAIDREGEKSFETTAKLNILPTKITLRKKGKPFWTLQDAKGSATFNQDDTGNFSLTGIVEDHGKSRHLAIDGIGGVADEGQAIYAIDLELKGEDSTSDTNFHFSARKLSDQWSFGEVELFGFGVEELDLIQHLIGKNYPKWQHVHLHQGNIDAAMLVYLKGFRLSEVHVEHVAAHGLSFSFDPWGLNASVENALGSLSFDFLGEDPLKTLNADLKIHQGKLNFGTAVEEDASWHLSGIDTHLTVDKGVVQKSLLKGTIAGLEGEIELDGTIAGPSIQFGFHGQAKDFAQALPDRFRNGYKAFIGDQLKIIGVADRKSEGLLFNAKLLVKTEDQLVEDIRFGFTLGRSSEGLWRRWPPPSLAADYYSKAGLEAVHSMVPPIALPIYSAYCHLVSQNLGYSGFTLKDGWFQAEKLPLAKYISPFLFSHNQMQLGGLGDFSGVFDQQKIVVNYDVQDMVLENDDFAIELKSLSEEEASNKLVATFMFDFDKKSTSNTFPIRKATYFEKNSGLLYTEIDAALSMEETIAHFDDLTAYCNGLYFAGSAVVDWSKPGEGVFNVDMHAHEMHGKISQLQHLLSHLNKSLIFLKIPIEGNVGLQKQGGHLSFSFDKDGYELEALVQGEMTDGQMSDQNTDLSLQELSMHFAYDHQANKLAFTDIQGTLLVGKPSHVEEYAVGGDGVRFSDFSKNEAGFDIWIGDKTRDILRLAGKTRSDMDDHGIPYTNFLFNRSLTHFGDVHPAKIQLAFKDWSQLELFQLKCEFQLKDLLADLQRFSRTGLFFLSRGLLKELNELDVAKGAIKADLNYDPERSMLNYRIHGNDLAFGTRNFANFLLVGSKKGSLWSVNQMQIDDISLAFDVLKEGPLWNINFLGARLGNYLLVGMEGQYSDEDSRLEAKINLFEADLSRVNEWPLVGSSLASNMISGQMRASGSLHAEFDKAMPHGMHLNANLNGTLNHASVKNILLDDIKNMSVKYDTARGLSVGNLDIGVRSSEGMKARVFLQDAGYDTVNSELLLDGLHFDIPVENLPWAVQQLQENFPEKITEPVAEVIRSSKQQGSLKGSLRISSSNPYSALRLHLGDGIYHFGGKEHDLSGFVMDYDPFALKVFTEYRYKKHRLRLDVHSSASDFDAGEIMVSDFTARNIPSSPLTIYWKIHPQAGFYIRKMAGDISGMTFDFDVDLSKNLSDESLNLVGKVDVNFRKAVGMMDEEIAARIVNLELGEGYSLAGQWHILKSKSKPLSDSIFFQGELAGRDFEFFGYRFYNFSSQLSYSPEFACMRDLTVTDSCGSVEIGHMDFLHRGNGYWQMIVPIISVSEFRPSLLNSTKSMTRPAKSLVIRSLEITDVNGVLGDRNTFTGNGQLVFANPPKKNLQHSILAIPAELLTRIGLDMAVLTPVRGTIDFDIRDGKANLQRFKDVYSKGRLSKFYLANSGSGSYVDFDGNLNLQVRMKQYNIIFKLAELFTVNVQGTLRKPTYALQTQKQDEHPTAQ